MSYAETAIPGIDAGVAEKKDSQNPLLKMELRLLRYWIPSLVGFGALLFALLGFSVLIFGLMMDPIKEDIARIDARQEKIIKPLTQ